MLRVPEPETVVFLDRVTVLVASAVDDNRVAPSTCGMLSPRRGYVCLTGLCINQRKCWVVIVELLGTGVVFARKQDGMDIAVAKLAVDIFAAKDVDFVTDGGNGMVGSGKGSPVWIQYD